MSVKSWIGALLLCAAAGPAATQGALQQAAEVARAAWLAHDPQALVGQSPSVVLQIPGADPSAPLSREQAVELLRRHLRTAAERSLLLTSVREVAGGKGFVELERRYVVPGTSDVRRETVFLGFRRWGDAWVLSEVRIGP